MANLLAGTGDLTSARSQFEISLRLRPDDAVTRYNYAVLLGRMRQFDGAQRELEAALRADHAMVDAHLLLGDLLMARDQAKVAIQHYREALRIQPQSGRAHLSLGSALASGGDVAGAIPHLQKQPQTPTLSCAKQRLKRFAGWADNDVLVDQPVWAPLLLPFSTIRKAGHAGHRGRRATGGPAPMDTFDNSS